MRRATRIIPIIAGLLTAAFLAAPGFCVQSVSPKPGGSQASSPAPASSPSPSPSPSSQPTRAPTLPTDIQTARPSSPVATAAGGVTAVAAQTPAALKNPLILQNTPTKVINLVDRPIIRLPHLGLPGSPPASSPDQTAVPGAEAAFGASRQAPSGTQQSPANLSSNLSMAKTILGGMPPTPDVVSALSMIDAYNRSGAAMDPSALNSALATAGMSAGPAAAKTQAGKAGQAVPAAQGWTADLPGQVPASISAPAPASGPDAKRQPQGGPILVAGSRGNDLGLTDVQRAQMKLLETSQLLDQNPDDVNARADRAEALNTLGDYDAAAEEASKALQLDPTSIKALNARAYANNKRGQYAFALQDADLVVKLAPNNAMGHLNRAMALEGLGRWDEALREYELAANLDPAMRAIFRDAQARRSGRAPASRGPLAALSRHLVWAGAALLLALGLPLGLYWKSKAGRKGPAPAQAVDVGTVIGGNYRIERLIGEGGMGKVFEGFDTVIRRKVAVKMMLAELRREIGDAQILDEARLVALARHPNIVEIFAVLQEAGEIFLVFEFVAGRPLYTILQAKGRVSLSEAAHILGQVAAGLDCAHAKRVIHRDLKPANVVISNEGVAKLMDFGIAHRSGAKTAQETAGAAGTLPYMAPEQHLGAVCKESDLYALGVMAYELLTGVRPFSGPSTLELKQKMSYAPASSLAPDLPPRLDAFLARALAADPAARFHSGKEFIDALTA